MKILFATDASSNAEAAAKFLKDLRISTEIDLILLSVVQMPDLHHVLGGKEYEDDFFHKQDAQIREHYERVIGELDGLAIRFEQHVLQGHPGKTIVAEAKHLEADLILMGAIGNSVIDRLILGSTSEFVASNAKCSVVVVRPQEQPLNQNGVLVGFDGSPNSKLALQFVTESEWLNSFPITVLTVGEPELAVPELASLLESDAMASLDIKQVTVQANHPGKALCEYAAKNSLGLTVIGSTGRGKLAQMLLGSVSKYVLQNAPSSVWVCRGSA
ncbi:MAG: universal stress protein [bacterium]|nr:universal stress protein [bacterium]